MTYLDDVARGFCDIIKHSPGAEYVDTDDYGWENHRWRSPLFRLAHVEIFNQDRFMVVHTCIFPHVTDPSPIFGFDVIASDSKVTGLFWDLSPTVDPVLPFADLSVERNRQRPEWGDIFSEHWVACRPDAKELEQICRAAGRMMPGHIKGLGQRKADPSLVAAAQDRYCLQQRRNEHTVRAVTNLLGPERAQDFVANILFPTVGGH